MAGNLIDQALTEYLQGYAGLVAIVGGRVYALIAPDDPLTPYVVFRRVSTPREHTQSGAAGMAQPRFQIECWGETKLVCVQAIEQVRFALDGFKGQMGVTYPVTVGDAYCEGDNDDYDHATRLYGAMVDVRIRHEEAIS